MKTANVANAQWILWINRKWTRKKKKERILRNSTNNNKHRVKIDKHQNIVNMVSLPYAMMYSSQKHASNLTYPPAPSAWYSNYSSHHHANNQFLNAAPSSIGAGPNGLLDSDPAAAAAAAASSYYNSHHHHHHMLHSSSPDWVNDNYNLQSNSQFFSNGVTPPTSLHLSPPIQNHHTPSGNSIATANDHLTNGLSNNIPPSPPITVNSACSEMSSPGIGSNGNGGAGGGNGGVLGSAGGDDESPHHTDLSRAKSPYGWLKKASYQNQPVAGMCPLLFCCVFEYFFLSSMQLCSMQFLTSYSQQ